MQESVPATQSDRMARVLGSIPAAAGGSVPALQIDVYTEI
jgi:hypothetical protein